MWSDMAARSTGSSKPGIERKSVGGSRLEAVASDLKPPEPQASNLHPPASYIFPAAQYVIVPITSVRIAEDS